MKSKYFTSDFLPLLYWKQKWDENHYPELGTCLREWEGFLLPVVHLCVSAKTCGNTRTCEVPEQCRDHNRREDEISQIPEQEHQWVTGATVKCVMAFWSVLSRNPKQHPQGEAFPECTHIKKITAAINLQRSSNQLHTGLHPVILWQHADWLTWIQRRDRGVWVKQLHK